ncbi:MAG: ATP-NAD kinase family protein [Thermoplasmataceae archaeon]|jgi:predicted polyphosphate/ATP-dependent NAD kinase
MIMIAGFFVNPIAGCGSMQGMKGSDYMKMSECRESVSLGLAVEFLRRINHENITFLIPSGDMGEKAFTIAGLHNYRTIYDPAAPSTSMDTKKFVEILSKGSPGILVFFGGDGTARDIVDTHPAFPVIGVPAGSKMYSSVFAISLDSAVRVFNDVASGMVEDFVPSEVIDLDERVYSTGRIETRFYGELLVPNSSRILMESKAEYTDDYVQDAAEYIHDHIENDVDYLIGPGTTCKSVLALFGQKGSILGFDLFRNGRIMETSMNEARLYEIASSSTRMIISPIGGQGFLLGRGNREISPRVLKKIDPRNITVIASPRKLENLKVLYIDTGGEKIAFPQYVRVLYGYGKFKMVKVEQ